MLRIGLTGGIASGKSEVQRILEEHHVPVLDSDRVAHEAMRAGTRLFERVVEAFGEEVVGPDGELDREELGRRVFADPRIRGQLNDLVHPEVARRWRRWLEERSGSLAVVAVPLLFECGFENDFDGVLCVHAPEVLRKQRLIVRGLDERQAQQRIQSQWPEDRRVRASTWVIENDRDLKHLRRQVEDWLREQTGKE